MGLDVLAPLAVGDIAASPVVAPGGVGCDLGPKGGAVVKRPPVERPGAQGFVPVLLAEA
jgi:hypothetical protein